MYQMGPHGVRVERGGGVCTLWCLFQAAPLLKHPMAPSVCLQFEAAAPHAVACLCLVWDEIEAPIVILVCRVCVNPLRVRLSGVPQSDVLFFACGSMMQEPAGSS